MIKIIATIAALALPSAVFAQAPVAPAREPIQVMVLGTFHFDNPGRDLHNLPVDPVTTPRKQAELAAVAEALSAFHPTAVAIERQATAGAGLIDPDFRAFSTTELLTNADERLQLGYRLATVNSLSRVYAIDEKPGEGKPDYFPFDAVQTWVTEHGQDAALEALNGPVGEVMQAFAERQKTDTMGALLADTNRRDHPVFGNVGLYYGLLQFGDAVEQPGAGLNAGWYQRNARIFAKLMTVAQPGDRIVIVFGAGHAYWLRHFIENTPGFELVDPAPYLAGT